MARLIPGENDLATLFPQIAAEANGWDPSLVLSRSNKTAQWICAKGHKWEANICNRTRPIGGACPYCTGKRVLAGINDLKTKIPGLASEADGWDPSTVMPNANKKRDWKCINGHTWSASPNFRANTDGSFKKCPYCSGIWAWKGETDLQTKYPDIARQASGWDPSTIHPGSRKNFLWVCELGHKWKASALNRTHHNSGCPYCSNSKVLKGFNDLATTHPDIAATAHGWDPSTLTAGVTLKKVKWICSLGHTWSATPASRTIAGTNCPVCSGNKLLPGFNDLKTKYPEIAAEAYGWDPEKVFPSTIKKVKWKCPKGHIYITSLVSRTTQQTGCPECAETGFNPLKPAWFYLMDRPGEQQFGISNVIEDRLQFHRRKGWSVIEVAGPYSGKAVLETETELKSWLRKEIGLIDGTSENWLTTNMEFQSLRELFTHTKIEPRFPLH